MDETISDSVQDITSDEHDSTLIGWVPVLMPSSCLDNPDMMGLDPPDLTSDDAPEKLLSSPPAKCLFADGPKYINNEQNTLIAYYVTSYRSQEESGSSSASYTSPGYRPRYIATGQNMFLNFERAEEYARLLYEEVVDLLAPHGLEERYINQTMDPKMFEFPAWVRAARLFGPSSTSAGAAAQNANSSRNALSSRPSRSFHAAYPGQRPRLPSASQNSPSTKEESRRLEGIVGVIVLPMAMLIDDSVADMTGEEVRIHLGLMRTDVIEEIMREFRAIMNW
jgi:hypothetical protein